MRKEYLTISPNQTKKLGETLAKEILKTQPKKLAQILGLEGDLGGGKTTFLQGLARGLGIKQKILSPTFILMRKYQLTTNNKQLTTKNRRLRVVSCKLKSYFYHIDCYRIKKPKEILDLGFREIISNPKNTVAIEWSDHVRKIIPEDSLIIKFELANKNKRKIVINKKWRNLK